MHSTTFLCYGVSLNLAANPSNQVKKPFSPFSKNLVRFEAPTYTRGLGLAY